MHTHLSMIPDTVTVSCAGLVRLNMADNHAHGSTCDDRGRTVHRVESEPALMSVALFTETAAKLALDILTNLPDDDRRVILRTALGL